MKTFTLKSGVKVSIFKDDNGIFFGGLTFGFNDRRNECGYLDITLKGAFARIRRTIEM